MNAHYREGAPAPTYRGGDAVAEIVRSGFTESLHRGSVAVVDPSGNLVAAIGDAAAPIFPRSANKPVQALAMLSAGWEPASEADLAISAASHRGEPVHLARVASVLSSAGLGENQLQCPPDLPGDPAARRTVVAAGGRARRAYMTCSGKHAAMLATCVKNGWETETYREVDHPLHLLTAALIEAMAGENIRATGVDGCGAPIFAISLTGLARSASRLVEAEPGTPERAVADAMRNHPVLVEGTDRIDTRAMQALPGLLAKFGAEGVHVLAAPGVGAVAVKIDDGAGRASMPVALRAMTTIAKLPVPESAKHDVEDLVWPEVWGGDQPVGRLRTLL